jgi:peptidyl-prolyl cis-trans isomerase B (cyclophilin B)
VSSTIQRQRAAARARLERQMGERVEEARKRKQRNAVIGAAVALLLVIGGAVWLVSAVSGDDEPAANNAAAAPGNVVCAYTPDESGNKNLKDVGTPQAQQPNKGKQVMSITTNLGVIEVEVNTAKAPCTAASMTYLASKNFYDGTKCHRLTTEGIKVLQCGDPAGDGTGGPTYKMAEENLPNKTDPAQNYPAGTVAMAKTSEPGTTGSQFFLVYGDTPLPAQYTVLGTITKGLEIVEKIGKEGAVDKDGKTVGDGAPKNPVTIKTLTVTPAES